MNKNTRRFAAHVAEVLRASNELPQSAPTNRIAHMCLHPVNVGKPSPLFTESERVVAQPPSKRKSKWRGAGVGR